MADVRSDVKIIKWLLVMLFIIMLCMLGLSAYVVVTLTPAIKEAMQRAGHSFSQVDKATTTFSNIAEDERISNLLGKVEAVSNSPLLNKVDIEWATTLISTMSEAVLELFENLSKFDPGLVRRSRHVIYYIDDVLTHFENGGGGSFSVNDLAIVLNHFKNLSYILDDTFSSLRSGGFTINFGSGARQASP